MMLLLARAPSGNPKTDAHSPVYEQAISGAMEGVPSAGLLDSISNLGSKLGVQLGPTFSGLQILAVACGSIANQPIDILQAAEMLHVGCHAWKTNGVIDDRRAELSLFHQSFAQTRQHLFLGQLDTPLFNDLPRAQKRSRSMIGSTQPSLLIQSSGGLYLRLSRNL